METSDYPEFPVTNFATSIPVKETATDQDLNSLLEWNKKTVGLLESNIASMKRWLQTHDPQGLVQQEYEKEKGQRRVRKSETIAHAGSDGNLKVAVTNQGIIKITPPEKQEKAEKDLKKVKVKKIKKVTPEPEAEEGDYSKAKPPASQVPITQFMSYCDQFFRPLTENDLKFLDPPEEDRAFMIPPLGNHYKKQWESEDAVMSAYEGQYYSERDDTVYEVKGLGKLHERLLQAFVKEGVVPNMMDEDDDLFAPISVPCDEIKLEDRLREELKQLGLYEENQSVDDNELTREMRRLQDELSKQMSANQAMKDQIKSKAQKLIAWQEYCQLLDDISKTIETTYLKRYRVKKGKKKKESKSLSEGMGHVIDSRRKLIQEVGKVFFKDFYNNL